MKHITADIHCHPTMKPYGHSFPRQTPGETSAYRSNIYYYDRQTFWDKIKNKLLGLTNFSQANCRALRYGGVNVVFASLYPIEKAFCRTRYGTGELMDNLLNLASGISEPRIDYVQNLSNGYFDDLEAEYQFLKSWDGKEVEDGNKTIVYKLVSRFSDIELDNSADEDSDRFVINMFLSIEGGHVFYSRFTDITDTPDDAIRQNVFGNIDRIKQWEHVPVFITFAHHFWNGMGGHAESLAGIAQKITQSQIQGMDEPLNNFGRDAIRRLLDNSEGKRRILIDIKHMSEKARADYFTLLETEYAGQAIPVVVSHGAVRGNASNRDLFCDKSINFSDAEILTVGRSKGLFGVQFDERRIASAAEIRQFSHYTRHRKVMYHAAELIWRQIEHMAQVLDANGLFAWGIQCIGSDNDGMVNPVDGIWTSEQFADIEGWLLMHAHTFIKSERCQKLTQMANKALNEEEIVDRFMGLNAYDFLQRTT